MLTIYNSLTRTKERFIPIQPGKIGLYACGITVYDRCHLGHARSMVCFDVIVRFLRAQGLDVTYVRNITDIDDKIILRAHERGVSIQALTQQFIDAMHDDARALAILPPDLEPRATEKIDSIVRLIERLMASGHAYVGEDGDVYYAVTAFSRYGQLSNQNLDALETGVRIDVAAAKQTPLDFVLWKHAKPGEPYWPSPFGNGRPGWHIECSAMAMDALGEQFDLHGGGLDLQFPHHENEIAQSEAATGKPFANYWLHVGLLQVNHEKMSKSTGNFLTIADVLKKHHPEVIRYFLLSSHYRSGLNYSEENLLNAERALTRLYQTIKSIEMDAAVMGALSADELDATWLQSFNSAMNDDFNTPVALSVLFELSHAINKTKSLVLAQTLIHLSGVLGLLQEKPTEFLQAGLDATTIAERVAARFEARKNKDWATADAIRVELQALGVEVEDGVNGSTWRVVRE